MLQIFNTNWKGSIYFQLAYCFYANLRVKDSLRLYRSNEAYAKHGDIYAVNPSRQIVG